AGLCSAIAALSHLSYSPAPVTPAEPGASPLASLFGLCNKALALARCTLFAFSIAMAPWQVHR
ncbi:hypothetical protein, partial [uncultured Sphingomonas sp.]|uniref:hypothetical protein n=1 Tax=uncultured Sphingomonas sp. TaxID=158754 RepID=UPI0035CBB983